MKKNIYLLPVCFLAFVVSGSLSAQQDFPDVTAGMDFHLVGKSIIYTPDSMYCVQEIDDTLQATDILIDTNAIPDVQGFYSFGVYGWSIFWTPNHAYSLREIDGVQVPAEITDEGDSIVGVLGCYRHSAGITIMWTFTNVYSISIVDDSMIANEVTFQNLPIAGTQGLYKHSALWSILWTPARVLALRDTGFAMEATEILFDNLPIASTQGLYKHDAMWSILWTPERALSILDDDFVLVTAEITNAGLPIPGVIACQKFSAAFSIIWTPTHTYSLIDIDYVLTTNEILYENQPLTNTRGIYHYMAGWSILWNPDHVYSLYDIDYVITPAEMLFNNNPIPNVEGCYRHPGIFTIMWTPTDVYSVMDIDYVLVPERVTYQSQSLTQIRGVYNFEQGWSILWNADHTYCARDTNYALEVNEILYEQQPISETTALMYHLFGTSILHTPDTAYKISISGDMLQSQLVYADGQALRSFNLDLLNRIQIASVQVPFDPFDSVPVHYTWMTIDSIPIWSQVTETPWGLIYGGGGAPNDTIIYDPDTMIFIPYPCFMIHMDSIYGVMIMTMDSMYQVSYPDSLDLTLYCDTSTFQIHVGPIPLITWIIIGWIVDTTYFDTIIYETGTAWVTSLDGVGITGTPVEANLEFVGQPRAVVEIPVNGTPAGYSTTVWAVEMGNVANPDYTYMIVGPEPAGGVLEGDAVKMFGNFRVDRGDAPDPPYATLEASDGPAHGFADTTLFLGMLKDAEEDGLPDATATGDDISGLPDEDGVQLTVLVPGEFTICMVTANNGGGLLNAWIDFNSDGDWTDAGEQIANDLVLQTGPNALGINVPANAVTGFSFARFRYAAEHTDITGITMTGEVEDYRVSICPFLSVTCPPPVFLCLNDPPLPLVGAIPDGGIFSGPGVVNNVFYPNLAAAGVIILTYNYIEPVSGCEGSCNMTIVVNALPLVVCPPDLFVSIEVPVMDLTGASPPGGLFSGAGVIGNQFYPALAGPGPHQITYQYQDPATGCSDACTFQITCLESSDMGDAPDPGYPTLLTSDGARHTIIDGMFLGSLIDGDPNGQPNNLATGDDDNALDDEDGVIRNWGETTGSPVNITVTASISGILNAWMDFNNNSSWADAGEQIFTDQALVAGDNILSFLLPSNALNINNFVRFRFSSQTGLTFSGQVQGGEVEDYKYQFSIPSENKWLQPPNSNLAGIDDHDTALSGTILADDWLCYGGDVTNIHWFGSYQLTGSNEKRGSGVSHFHLEILGNNDQDCLPSTSVLYAAVIPFNDLNETATGMVSSTGALVYEYSWLLPGPFAQMQGQRYWLKLTAHSVDPADPAFWRWQEAARSHKPALCSSVKRQVIDGTEGPWQAVTEAGSGTYAEMAFSIGGILVPGDITGQIRYDNPTANYPVMTNTWALLKQYGSLVDSALTNTGGTYLLDDIVPGFYRMDGKTSKAWGGVNSTDALRCLKFFVAMESCPGPDGDTLVCDACDVNGSGSLNAVDALMISRRFVGMLPTFPVGSWLFAKPAVTVVQGGTPQVNYLAICYGDANRNFVPSLSKTQPQVQLTESGRIAVKQREVFDVPLKAAQNLEAGAISLVLDYPSDWQILDVLCPWPAEGGFFWKAEYGMLRISWFSLDPMLLREGREMFTLRCLSLNEFGSDVHILAEGSSVISDAAAREYDMVTLTVPQITVLPSEFWLAQNQPNPFNDKTLISFGLPIDSKVTILIFNQLGEVISRPLNGETLPAGKHHQEWDAHSIPAGVYTLKMEAVSDTRLFIDSRRLVLVR